MRVDLVLRGAVRTVALDQAALDLAGDAHEVVGLGDGVLMPAFGDGHVHPLQGGVDLAGAGGAGHLAGWPAHLATRGGPDGARVTISLL